MYTENKMNDLLHCKEPFETFKKEASQLSVEMLSYKMSFSYNDTKQNQQSP